MGRVVPGETSTTMKVLAILFLATLAYAAPEAEPKADADAAADAWYAYYAIPTDTMGMADTMADGADTTVDTTDILDTMDTVDGGSAMLKPMPNPKLMPRPTPLSSTPPLTVMPLSILMDTLTDTPALTTLMLITMLPLSIPLLLWPTLLPTDTTLTPLVLFMPLPSVRLMKSKDLILRLTLMLMPGVTTDVTTDTPDTTDGVTAGEDITDTQDTIMENKPSFHAQQRS